MARVFTLPPLPACALIAFAILAPTGCRHAAVAVQGRSSFAVLEPLRTAPPPGVDQDPSPTDLEVDQIPGHYSSRDCVLPVYPPRALAAGAGTRRIWVKISFDETGNPTDVAPSWRGLPDCGRFSDDFVAAVRDAVMRWTITPPHLVYYQREAAGPRKYLRTEALPESLDVVFTFTASGQVKADHRP